MSKSLQRGILFAVCVALVLALSLTLVFFTGGGDKNILSAPQGQVSGVADAAANAYEHGSNIGRSVPSGVTPVDNETDFLSALREDKSVSLLNNISLSSENTFPRSSSAMSLDYSGTVYGNGHTVSFVGKHATDGGEWTNPQPEGADDADWNMHVNYFGGIVGQLLNGGHIYDLNVVMTSGSIAFKTNDNENAQGDTWLDVGGIAGIVNSGASIENCTFSINDSSSRMAALKYPRGTVNQWSRAGGIAGELNGGSIINCTVTNNGWIESGEAGKYDYPAGNSYHSAVGNIVGWINSGTIDNVRVAGSGNLKAFKAAGIGVINGSEGMTTSNYYNNFTGAYTVMYSDNGGGSSAAYASSGTRTATVTNYFNEGATGTSGATTITNTLQIPSSRSYELYFDPTISDYANSLAIGFTGQPTIPSGYERTYTLTSATGTQYTNQDNFIVSDNGATVVVKGLPSATSNWNSSNGTFTANLTYEDTPIFQIPNDPIPSYEHGYVPKGYSATTGSKEISTGAEFTELFRPNGTVEQSGSYYLSEDIAISGFSGIDFSGGTLDGAGHTIYIIDKLQDTYNGPAVGGLVGQLGGGTIKNLRIVYVNSIDITVTNSVGRIGLVAGSVNGGTIQNVEVIVQKGVTIGATNTNDHDFAMGGVLGTASGDAKITDVTVELNGTLNPTGKYTALGGIVGIINSVNGAKFTDVAIRGTGTFDGVATNDTGEPACYGAIAVVRSAAQGGSDPQGTYATVDGLIYDFDVTLDGDVNNVDAYACYYLFTYNYNGRYSDGWQTGSPISEYNKAVSYSNVFVNSAYEAKLAEYAGQRTNGNAAVGVAEGVINTVQNKVEGLENPVAAYFNPADGADDMIFRASGSWDSDRMVILTLSDGTVRESVLETAGVNTSAKLVYAPKALAATDNVVQLSLYENVNWPTAPAALTYSGAEQSFAFTLQTVSGTPVDSGDYTVAYSVQEGDTGVLGENNLPLNAGTYTATITLTNGMEFIDDGQGTTSPEYSLTVTVNPFTVQGTWALNGGLTLTYGDPDPSDIDQYIDITLTSSNIPGGLTSVTAEGFTTDYTQGAAAGTTVNVTAGTYSVDSGLAASNYDFTGITGSGSVEVQKKELTISESPVDSMGHITDNYGENVTTFEALADLFEAEGMSYVQGLYGSDAVTFAVTALTYDKWYDDGADGAWELNADAASMISGRLYGNTAYNVGVTLASDNPVNNNYDLQSSIFVYAILPLPITITGVELNGFDGDYIYDGDAHDIKVNYTGALDGDELEFTIDVILNNGEFDGTALTDAGTYSVSVSFDQQNAFHGEANYNYDIDVDGSSNDPYEVTIKPFDLTNAVISITSEQFTYDGTEKTVEYTVLTAEGGKDITSMLTPAGNKQTNAGDAYTLTLTGGDNFTNQATATWSIGKAKLSVTAPTAITFMDKAASELSDYLTTGEWITGFFGSDDYALGAWTNDPGDSAVIIGDVAYAAAGTYTAAVRLTGENADTNYELSESTLSVTVNAYDLSNAEMTVGSLTYNGEEQTADVTVTANGADVTALLTVSGNTATAAGSNYTAKAEAKDSNFNGSIEKTFTVAQKQLKLESLNLSSSTYTGAPITVTGHTFAEGFAPADEEKPELSIVEETGATVQDAGTYTFDVTLKEASTYPVNANYVIAADGAKITATVSPASVTVTAGKNAELGALYGESATADTSRFYKDDFITLSAQPDETFTLSDALTFTVTNSEGGTVSPAEGAYTLAPGTYTVTYTINNIEGANYTLTADGELTTTLTVEEGALELVIERWDNTTLTYNGAAQLPTHVFADSAEIGEIDKGALVYTVTPKEGSTLTGSNDAVNAGSYTVTVSIAPDFAEQYKLVGGELSTDFTIKQLEVTLEWKADGDLVYDGEKHTATATVGNEQGDDVVEVIVGLVSGNDNINVGEFYFEATGLTGAAAGNYKLPVEKRQAFEVTPAQVKLTWNFTADAKITYGDSVEDVKKLVNTAALKGTIPGVTDPLTFEVSVGDYSAATAANTEVTFKVSYTLPEGAKAENYEITVSAAEGKDKLSVQRANITVTVSVEGKTYDGAAVTPSVTVMFGERELEASEYGAVTYTYAVKDGATLDAAPADASDSAYTVTANVAESTNFNAATSAVVEFKIERKTLTAGTWSGLDNLIYSGSAAVPVFSEEGVIEGDTVTVGYTIVGDNATGGQAINAGDYTATAKLEGDDAGNYEFDGKVNVKTFTILPKTVSVAWDDTELTYNGSAQKPTADIAAGGLIGEDEVILTVSGAQTDANRGDESYTATAEITGGADKDNYVLDESSASTTFTIAPKPITITFTSDQGGAIEFDVAGSVTVVGAWTIDSDNPGKATLVLSDGTTNITLTVEASGEALPTVGDVPALLLLLGSKPYEGTPYGTEVKGGSLTVVSANTNYVFEGAQAITLNITPAIIVGLKDGVQETVALELVLGDTYNDEYFKNNYFQVTGKDDAEVTGGTLEVTITPSEGLKLEEGAIKHAGTYTVTAVYTPAGAQEGAELPTFSFEFTVTPVKVTSVTYSGEPLVYGGLSESGKIAVTVEYADGNEESVTAQYTSENVSSGNWLNAGDTQVTVNYTGDNRDYAAVTDHVITLTVAQKTITATINYGEQSGTELTLTYNGSGYTIGAELNGVLSGDGVSAEVLQSFTDVAASPVEITLAGKDSGNYKVEGEYTVTITPADVTYEWSFADDAVTYGDSVEDVTALAIMPDGALLGVEEKVTFQVSVGDYSATTNAGTEVTFDVSYTLPESANADNYNIIITAADGNTLNVGKATLNLTIAESASLTKVYDGKAVTLGSLLTAGNVSVEGMKNGENAFTLGILAISETDEMTNAGAYNGSVSVIENCNYTAEAIEITYTVTPKPIGVAWTNTEFTYDGTAHKPTATATGLVEGDSLTLTVTGAQTNANAEGETYTATVKAFEQGNYKLESDSTRTFTIKKAAAALAIKDYGAIKDSVYKGSAFVVTPLLNGAEDTQGIVEVEFFDKTDSSETVAVQEIKNAGIYTVTLTVNNANYEYAQSYFTVTVSPKSIGVAWGTTEFTYNGSAQVPTATATGLVGGDSLTLTVTGAQTNAGSYTATVAAFEQGNYKLAEKATSDFTIKKADLTVTPASLEIRERETDVMQAFAEGEDLAQAFAGRISVNGVSGTVIYTATIAGDNNYDDDGLLTVGAHTFTIDAGSNYNAASVSVTVIATPVVTVIASVEGELVYNGSAFEISYALKEGAPEDVSMDDITVTASVETIVNAGEYEVNFTVTGSNEDYDYVVQDASGNAALTFTIARRGLDVAEVAEAVYGDLQVSGTLVTGTHTAFVAYNDEEIELIVNVKAAVLSRAAAEYLDAGEHEVTIALANEDGNFSLNGATLNPETEKMEVQSTLDVAPKSVTVGYTPSSEVYDAKGISLTLGEFEDMLIEGDDPAVNIYINDAPYTGKVVLDAGEYTVRYESADPNYAFAPVSATFTVAPKRVTPNFDLNTGSGSLQITGGGKLEIEEGEETDIVAAIDSFMQSSGVSEEEMSISVSGDLKLEDMATWAPGTYTVKVTLSGNHSGSMEFTVEVSAKVELPPPVQPELPETPAEAGSGSDWVLPLVIAIVALIDLALLVAIGVAAKKRA